MGIYDDPENLPIEKEEKSAPKKTKKQTTKKTSSSRVVNKKTSVKNKTQKKKAVVKKEEFAEEDKIKKLKRLKKRKNESDLDFLVRASVETGLQADIVAEQIKLNSSNKTKKTNETKINDTSSTQTSKANVDNPKITPQEFLNSVKPQPEYVKHLIKCRCVLSPFQKMENPPEHQFIVFSELKDDGLLKQHYAQCNNCGLIHKIYEVGLSETLKKETMLSLPSIDDFKNTLPEWLVNFLSQSDCDLHTWQEANFIMKHKLWGRFIILAKDKDQETSIKKVCQILGDNLYKIENVEEKEGWIEP